MQPAISFQNVSKKFRFSADRPKTVLETLVSVFNDAYRSKKRNLWAVRDLNLDIMPGECVGIVGRNGSGKSTMLKLCTRILRPSSGQVVTYGRISALLELGTGFHPDMTGRENVYLNASLLGLDRETVSEVFDEIVAFSELSDFIDVPVKNYSSGMYMRLGFSVAIHMRPDILIVDEILAVGDAAFQKKCFERIYDLKSKGVTIVVVSHQLDVMRELCDKLIWMEKGEMRQVGATDAIIDQYLSETYTDRIADGGMVAGFQRWGSGELLITDVRFINEAGESTTTFHTGDAMTIEFDYEASTRAEYPEFGLAIHRSKDGLHLIGPNNRIDGVAVDYVEGNGTVRYRIDSLPFQPDKYIVTIACHNSKFNVAYDYHNRAYTINVLPKSSDTLFGVLDLGGDWEIDSAEAPVETHRAD